ncbi:hypothetical protein ACIQUQ_19445 [Streptomyces sp. NPDC101118]|uniref:hypothetical protein n=1 Tax=Streptomyces sp. NPDC101118 TaxID=3366109 RepID=UPI0038212FCC
MTVAKRLGGPAGGSLTSAAHPVLALLELDATTGQIARPAFPGRLPPALPALHAGALADRHSQRRQMITGNPLTRLPLPPAAPGAGREFTIGAALLPQLGYSAAAGTTPRSIRQIVTGSRTHTRMQAPSNCPTSGARPPGALPAGGPGTWAGVRPALAVGACLLVVPLAVLSPSPLRGLRHVPDPPPEAAAPDRPDRPGRSGARR